MTASPWEIIQPVAGRVHQFPLVYSTPDVQLFVSDSTADEIFVRFRGTLRRISRDGVFTPVPHESGFFVDVVARQQEDTA